MEEDKQERKPNWYGGRPKGRKKKISWSDEKVYNEVLIPVFYGEEVSKIAKKYKLTRQAIFQQTQKRFGVNSKQAIMQFMIQELQAGRFTPVEAKEG